jgi:hypothetical protein
MMIEQHRIWVEQCEACATIRARFGLKSAFDYLVLEKLTTFAEAAAQHPAFARELPAFVAGVRRLFAPGELRSEFTRRTAEPIELDLAGSLLDDEADDDDVFGEPASLLAERAARFETIKELLLTDQLGVS